MNKACFVSVGQTNTVVVCPLFYPALIGEKRNVWEKIYMFAHTNPTLLYSIGLDTEASKY